MPKSKPVLCAQEEKNDLHSTSSEYGSQPYVNKGSLSWVCLLALTQVATFTLFVAPLPVRTEVIPFRKCSRYIAPPRIVS